MYKRILCVELRQISNKERFVTGYFSVECQVNKSSPFVCFVTTDLHFYRRNSSVFKLGHHSRHTNGECTLEQHLSLLVASLSACKNNLKFTISSKYLIAPTSASSFSFFFNLLKSKVREKKTKILYLSFLLSTRKRKCPKGTLLLNSQILIICANSICKEISQHFVIVSALVDFVINNLALFCGRKSFPPSLL